MSDSQGPTPPTAPNARPVKRTQGTSPFMQKKRRFARDTPSNLGKGPANGNKAPTTQPKPEAAQHSQPRPQNYQEFPIVISKADLGRGMRFHGIRFQGRVNTDGSTNLIDPYKEDQFTRPLRLHRRYARDKQQQGDGTDEQDGGDDKERELLNARRAERQAEREANQALIAPSGGSKKPSRKKPGKKIEDVYYDDNNPKQQKAAQLRYEETKPWHLEDFDGKHIFMGTYQEPLSDNSVLFQISADAFTMVPVERWYSFRQTDKTSVMTSEQVEKIMAKKYAPGRWYLNTQDRNEEVRRQQAVRRRADDDDDVKPRAAEDSYRADLDELDFEAKDEFQDDDEGLIFGDDDEDAKEIEKKVREEMRQANLPATNMKNEEKDYDAEEDKEREERKAHRKLQKKLRKRIVKHEKKYEYDSDSDHPYSESSEDETDSEEERRLEEERKKEEATKQMRSGASTNGNNTPAGRSEKRDPSRLGAVSLKRPGSPSLSDVSGNESRKRAKILSGRTASSSNLAADGAKSPLARSMAGYGSGSETDASRAGKAKDRRLISPHESQPGSRAQSPGRSGTPPPPRLPTIEEIRAAIPPAGISIKDLGTKFKTRVSKDKTAEFIALIKNNTVQDPTTKLLKSAAS